MYIDMGIGTESDSQIGEDGWVVLCEFSSLIGFSAVLKI